MAVEKSGQKKTSRNQKENVVDELSQLRTIVFGEAQAELDNRITMLESSIQDQLAALKKHIDQEFNQLKRSMGRTEDKLESKIAANDKKHDQKESELSAYANEISSDLKHSDESAHKSANDIQSRIDEEVYALSENFNKKIEDALEKLAIVSDELNSSKTDRKTLAKLLTTVATGLESE